MAEGIEQAGAAEHKRDGQPDLNPTTRINAEEK